MEDHGRKPNRSDNNPDNAGDQNSVGRGKPPEAAKFENKPVTGRIRTRRKPGGGKQGGGGSEPSPMSVKPGPAPSSSGTKGKTPPKPDKPADYDVGYARPPKQYSFKKGRSGNPKGRPKGSRNLETAIRDALQSRTKVRINGRIKTMTVLEVIVMSQSDKAMKGDRNSAKLLFDALQANANQSDEQAPLEFTDDFASLIIQTHNDMILEGERTRSQKGTKSPKSAQEPEGSDDD